MLFQTVFFVRDTVKLGDTRALVSTCVWCDKSSWFVHTPNKTTARRTVIWLAKTIMKQACAVATVNHSQKKSNDFPHLSVHWPEGNARSAWQCCDAHVSPWWWTAVPHRCTLCQGDWWNSHAEASAAVTAVRDLQGLTATRLIPGC